jgi:hypothetical protein
LGDILGEKLMAEGKMAFSTPEKAHDLMEEGIL